VQKQALVVEDPHPRIRPHPFWTSVLTHLLCHSPAIVIGIVYSYVPLMVLLLFVAPREIPRRSGVGTSRCMPSPGALLAFTFSFDDFVTTFFLSAPDVATPHAAVLDDPLPAHDRGQRHVDDAVRSDARRRRRVDPAHAAPAEALMTRQPGGMATRAVHGDDPASAASPHGMTVPVHTSTTYALDDAVYADIATTGGWNTSWYTRRGNPTIAAAARQVAALEGTQGALLFGSGMAAINAVLTTLVPPGGRVVAARDLYGDTGTLMRRDLPDSGRTATFVAVDDLPGWERALEGGADVLYVETLSNPMLRVADLPALARLARGAGALAVVDATFTSPVNVRAAEHGFDVIVQSATKYLNGHSDVIAGVVAADAAVLERLRPRAALLGGCIDPRAAALLSRGLKTLPLRMERHNDNALAVARHLDTCSEVEAVSHPLLPDHPDRALAERLLDGASGLVTFRVRGGDERAGRFMRACRVITEATSLGGVESLVCAPRNTSHLGFSAGELRDAGILPGTVRLSVGIEDLDDLVADLDQALVASASPE
jgi:cystathionine beta-lyase/cystathionine gamma-synthase